MDFCQDMSVNKMRRLCGFFLTQNSFILVVSLDDGVGVLGTLRAWYSTYRTGGQRREKYSELAPNTYSVAPRAPRGA
jgi:hypothetical protein